MPFILSEHTLPRHCLHTLGQPRAAAWVSSLTSTPTILLPPPGTPTAIWSGVYALCFFWRSVSVLLDIVKYKLTKEKEVCVLWRHSLLPFQNVFLRHFARIIHYYQGLNPHSGYIHVKFKNIWIIDWLFLSSFKCAAWCAASPCVPPWKPPGTYIQLSALSLKLQKHQEGLTLVNIRSLSRKLLCLLC